MRALPGVDHESLMSTSLQKLHVSSYVDTCQTYSDTVFEALGNLTLTKRLGVSVELLPTTHSST